jgi:hypothetical protein
MKSDSTRKSSSHRRHGSSWSPSRGVLALVVTDLILKIYGITAIPEGVYMARWFGLGLLAIGLTTWLARDAADSAAGRAVARALAVTYGIGVILALWGTLLWAFQRAGLGRGWD